MEFLIPFIEKYPVLSSIVFIIGAMRVVFKPIMSAIQAYVEYTPNTNDNEMLKKIMDSYIYQKLVWLIDYVGSIKLPK